MNCCICFACDEAYAPHFATALASLAANSARYDVFLLADDLQAGTRDTLLRFAETLGISLTIPDLAGLGMSRFDSLGRHTRTTWTKAFIAQVISRRYERILYLDSDLVVIGDLSGAFDQDLQGKAMGAVMNANPSINALEHPVLGLPPDSPYYNTGVLLIDPERWRDGGLTERIAEFALANPDRLHFSDQSAINATCAGDIAPIDPRFNLQKGSTNDDVAIVHYTAAKPWSFRDVPGREIYEFYRRQTPFAYTSPERVKYGTQASIYRKIFLYRLLRFLHLGRGLDRKIELGERMSRKMNKMKRHDRYLAGKFRETQAASGQGTA